MSGYISVTSMMLSWNNVFKNIFAAHTGRLRGFFILFHAGFQLSRGPTMWPRRHAYTPLNVIWVIRYQMHPQCYLNKDSQTHFLDSDRLLLRYIWQGKRARIKYKTPAIKKRKGRNGPSLPEYYYNAQLETSSLPIFTNTHCGVEGNRRHEAKRNNSNISINR